MISALTFWAMVGLAIAVVGIAAFLVWRSVEEDYEQVRAVRAYLFRLDNSIVLVCQRGIGGIRRIRAKVGRGLYTHLPVVLAEFAVITARAGHSNLVRLGIGKRRSRHRGVAANGQTVSPYMQGLVSHQRQVRRENGYHTPYDGSGIDQHGGV